MDAFRTARPEIAKDEHRKWVKTDDSPQVMMTWYEAAAYCNWLSEQEGIAKEQWCYEPNNRRKVWCRMKAKDKFWESDGVSVADGGGMGICVPSGNGDQPLLRADRKRCCRNTPGI